MVLAGRGPRQSQLAIIEFRVNHPSVMHEILGSRKRVPQKRYSYRKTTCGSASVPGSLADG